MPSGPAGRVVISYRRQDAHGSVGRVYDRLSRRFGKDQVFMDVDKIPFGDDFAEAIHRAVSTCDVVVAVIGPRWLTATDEDGRRRLDDADDFVRLEITAALERDIPVIPVLVEGALMPRRQELPEDLAGLARRHALSLRHESFDSDTARLVARIESILRGGMTTGPGSTAATPRPKAGIEAERRVTTPTAPPLPETRNLVERGRHAQGRSGKLTSAGAPVLPAPQLTGRHGNPLQVQLTWSEVSGAHEYVLERASDNRGGDSEFFHEVYRGPDRSFNEIPAQSTSVASWRYRVRASASGQAGRWSDTLSLHTGFGM